MRKSSFLKQKRKASGKTATLLIALILVMAVTAGGTVAYLVTSSGEVKNIFNVSQVSCKVEDGRYITNTSDVPAHLRAAVVVTWQNASGEVYGGDVPNATVTPPTGWVQHTDGYYYYVSETGMSPGSSGGAFQVTCDEEEPDGFSLAVEILAEAIQARGVDENGNKPVELAWGVDILNTGVVDATIEGGAGV